MNKLISIIVSLILVPVVFAQEPSFKIFEKSSPPMIFSKSAVKPKEPKIEIKQLNEIEYSDLIKIVKQGKSVTVAVGDTSLKADYFVKRIPDTEIGIWSCYLENGNLLMKKVQDVPKSYFPRIIMSEST